MKNLIEKVEEFNTAFNLPIRKETTNLDRNEIVLQYRLLLEELEEYADAAADGDLVEVADAIGDMLYVLIGTAIRHGIQDKLEDIFNEIHRSNMSKLEDGKPLYNEYGKVIKSSSYSPPNIKFLL
jgi:predicted HAD superfamily Cof-like phosphohydrolase